MTLSLAAVVLFAIVVLPGYVAQRSRHLRYPPSTLEKTTFAELGEYMLDSVWIHAIVLLVFTLILWLYRGSTYLRNLKVVVFLGSSKSLIVDHFGLIVAYSFTTLVVAYLYGIFRGWQLDKQPVIVLLSKVFNFAFSIAEIPVWHAVLSQKEGTRTCVEVQMKDSGNVYSGALTFFPISPDSCDSKDFYLTDVFYRASGEPHSSNRRLSGGDIKYHGILLNSANVESIRIVVQQVVPQAHTVPGFWSKLRNLLQESQIPQ